MRFTSNQSKIFPLPSSSCKQIFSIFVNQSNLKIMAEKVIREYTNGEITVVWQPDECIHSTVCFKQLPKVFKPRERPWVKINAASTDEIIKTVEDCPTDALTWRYNDPEKKATAGTIEVVATEAVTSKPEVQITENGPLMIPAGINLKDASGKILKVNENKYLCRCGQSKNKPFCDGSHMMSGFKG
jgi:uncharacterized Fe-S cluster protein YjdI